MGKAGAGKEIFRVTKAGAGNEMRIQTLKRHSVDNTVSFIIIR